MANLNISKVRNITPIATTKLLMTGIKHQATILGASAIKAETIISSNDRHYVRSLSFLYRSSAHHGIPPVLLSLAGTPMQHQLHIQPYIHAQCSPQPHLHKVAPRLHHSRRLFHQSTNRPTTPTTNPPTNPPILSYLPPAAAPVNGTGVLPPVSPAPLLPSVTVASPPFPLPLPFPPAPPTAAVDVVYDAPPGPPAPAPFVCPGALTSYVYVYVEPPGPSSRTTVVGWGNV